MKKIISTLAICLVAAYSFGQDKNTVTTYLLAQYNKTITDRTKGNNPWGMGLGLNAFLNCKSKFKPSLELTGDVYLEDDKVLRADASGSSISDVRGVVNLFLGSSYYPAKNIYVSLAAGPSLIGGNVLLGFKPSFGFHFGKIQRWTGKVSYINILNRDKITGQDFSSLSVAIGLKLF
ncbi:MAG: hypothetical protein QM726_18790 [Chitinophagaceae bacterium]